MKLWLRLAARNATRNLRRTLLTAATVVISCALLTLALAFLGGVWGQIIDSTNAVSGHIRIVTKGFAQREQLFPLYENIENVDALVARIRELPGVVDAFPRIQTGVVITADDEIGDNFALVIGSEPGYFERYINGPKYTIAGTWLSGAEKETVLGAKLAQELGVNVGDTVLLLGQTQFGSMSPITAKVVGIASKETGLGQAAFLPLAEIQYLADMEGAALEILVYGKTESAITLEPIVKRIRTLEGTDGLVADGWYDRDPWRAVLPMMDGIMGFIQFLVIFVAALAIFNTMTMSVLERTQEIGVMRAMGLTRFGTLSLFLVESMGIGLVGGVIGTLLGVIPSLYLQTYGIALPEDVMDKAAGGYAVGTYTFYANITPEIIVQSILVGVVIALVGATLPALRAASVQPVTAMRARR